MIRNILVMLVATAIIASGTLAYSRLAAKRRQTTPAVSQLPSDSGNIDISPFVSFNVESPLTSCLLFRQPELVGTFPEGLKKYAHSVVSQLGGRDPCRGQDATQVELFRLLMNADTDGDGLVKMVELAYRTDDSQADSDRDGYDDRTEATHGYNPNGSGRRTGDF